MQKVLRVLIWVAGAVALALLAVLAYIFLPGSAGRLEARFSIPQQSAVDFSTLRKVDKPNQYLVCAKDFCTEEPDLEPKVYAVDAAALLSAWQRVISVQTDTSVLLGDTGMGQMTFVQRTARMRYPDIITIEVYPVDGGSTHAVYSRSIYGRSDMGVNKARIDAWLKALDAEVRAKAA